MGMRQFWSVLICCVWTLALAAGCAKDDDSSGCQVSADCDRLSVCRESACLEVACTTAGQCNLQEVCAPVTAIQSLCTSQECTPGNVGECAEGQVCAAGLCLTPCSTVAECPSGLVCEQNLCKPPSSSPSGPCQGDACKGKPCVSAADCGGLECISGQCLPAGGCVSDANCPEGQTCNLDTKLCEGEGAESSEGGDGCTVVGCGEDFVCNEATDECEPAQSGSGKACAPCANNGECGATGACVALGGSQYCLLGCSGNGDCSSGYKCVDVPGSGARCIPSGGSCQKDCIQNGCPTGKACDFASGECITQLLACDSCQKDEQCGNESRCVIFKPGDRRCMPECKSGQCPAASACEPKDGVDICVPSGSACCYGDSCGGSSGCDNCPTDKPYCFQNQCVECLNSSQCSGGTCNSETKTCEVSQGSGCSPACGGSTPFCHPQLQSCVQCFNASQCPDGQLCSAQNACASTDDICQFCAAPYPACAEISGQKTCVQCVQNSDCPNNLCNTKTFLCEGGNVPTQGNCKSDADCPVTSQFNLRCDTGTGLCFDLQGQCDNVTAFCHGGTGSECISLFDLLGVDAAGLPPEFGGAVGLCTCNPLADLCPLIPGICGTSPPSKCFSGLTCDFFTSLLGSFLGGLSGSPEFSGMSFCGP